MAGCQSGAPEATLDGGWTAAFEHLPALRGEYAPLQSKAVGRTFHVYVRLPPDYRHEDTATYPIVYVLDGDSLFPILAANHLFLGYDESLPEAIVVGIAYGSFDPEVNGRGYDFSAPAPDATAEQGGAPAFLEFLRSELIPTVEARYRADPTRRVLFGQSRGGYLVLYTAFTDPDLFWGCIASNPSFDPGRDRFFSKATPASRKDIGLIVTSGTRDYPRSRENALQWFESWHERADAPWTVKTITIDGGTHASYSTSSYRQAMTWLFRELGALEESRP